MTQGDAAVIGAVVFGALGAVVGGAVGLANPGHRWIDVDTGLRPVEAPRTRQGPVSTR